MSPEPGPFEVFYYGPIQHPVLLWISAAAATGFCRFRRGLSPGVRGYCIGLGVLSAVDAWLTASEPFGLGPLPPALLSVLPLLFVLAGDFRYLAVVTGGTAEGRIRLGRQGLLGAAALTCLVPIFTQLVMWALPEALASARGMFLVYELAFLGLTVALVRWHPNVRSIGWIRALSGVVITYYGLWALADGIILGLGSDGGYLLRVAPNLLYYGGFIAALGLFAGRVGRPTLGPDS